MENKTGREREEDAVAGDCRLKGGGWLSQGHLVLQHHQCGCLHKLIPCTLIYKDYKLPLVCSGARSLCIQTAIQPCLLVVQNGTASLWFYLKTLTHIQTHIQYNYFSAAGFYLSFQAEKKKKSSHRLHQLRRGIQLIWKLNSFSFRGLRNAW